MKKRLLTTMFLMVMLFASFITMAQNMNRYITLTVQSGEDITIKLKADASTTPVKIVSGGQEYHITTHTTWNNYTYTTVDTVVTFYGNIQGFNCSSNGESITALDASHNTGLTDLKCHENQLTSLNVNGCTNLIDLWCYDNQLTNLDVSGCSSLRWFHCHENQLTSLNVSGCTVLKSFGCSENELSSLDVSACSSLNVLYCANNQLTNINLNACNSLEHIYAPGNYLSNLDINLCPTLIVLKLHDNQFTSLDVSGCPNLDYLNCHNNPLSTQAIDNIYCALPDRNEFDFNGRIYVLNDTLDENYDAVLASNKQNAIDKNWKVWYDNYNYEHQTHGDLHDTDIPETVGTYICVSVTGVSVGPTSITLQTDEDAQLTATLSPNNATNTNVTWSSNDNNIATVNANGLVAAVAPGNAIITVTTADGGFTATCNVTVNNTDGINTVENDDNLSLYPNPVSGLLNIESNTSIHKIEVFNVLGQLVDAINTNNNTYQYNTEKLNNGYYMFKIHTDNGTAVKKVMKQ